MLLLQPTGAAQLAFPMLGPSLRACAKHDALSLHCFIFLPCVHFMTVKLDPGLWLFILWCTARVYLQLQSNSLTDWHSMLQFRLQLRPLQALGHDTNSSQQLGSLAPLQLQGIAHSKPCLHHTWLAGFTM